MASPNQVLTHAARAAAKQLNKPLYGRARRARRALVRALTGDARLEFLRKGPAPENA